MDSAETPSRSVAARRPRRAARFSASAFLSFSRVSIFSLSLRAATLPGNVSASQSTISR